MKTVGWLCLALALTGCAESRYAHDPRAAVVGPAFLDSIAEYPPDRATEYYYPIFGVQGMTGATPSPVPAPAGEVSPVNALLIERPAACPEVQEITGQGYPRLEAKGVRLFTAANQ